MDATINAYFLAQAEINHYFSRKGLFQFSIGTNMFSILEYTWSSYYQTIKPQRSVFVLKIVYFKTILLHTLSTFLITIHLILLSNL